MKLAIDSRIDETVVSYGGYESMVFESKDGFDTMTVEYRCIKCDSNFIFYLQMHVLDYLQNLFQDLRIQKVVSNEQSEPNEPIKYINCIECNGEMMKFTII